MSVSNSNDNNNANNNSMSTDVFDRGWYNQNHNQNKYGLTYFLFILLLLCIIYGISNIHFMIIVLNTPTTPTIAETTTPYTDEIFYFLFYNIYDHDMYNLLRIPPSKKRKVGPEPNSDPLCATNMVEVTVDEMRSKVADGQFVLPTKLTLEELYLLNQFQALSVGGESMRHATVLRNNLYNLEGLIQGVHNKLDYFKSKFEDYDVKLDKLTGAVEDIVKKLDGDEKDIVMKENVNVVNNGNNMNNHEQGDQVNNVPNNQPVQENEELQRRQAIILEDIEQNKVQLAFGQYENMGDGRIFISGSGASTQASQRFFSTLQTKPMDAPFDIHSMNATGSVTLAIGAPTLKISSYSIGSTKILINNINDEVFAPVKKLINGINNGLINNEEFTNPIEAGMGSGTAIRGTTIEGIVPRGNLVQASYFDPLAKPKYGRGKKKTFIGPIKMPEEIAKNVEEDTACVITLANAGSATIDMKTELVGGEHQFNSVSLGRDDMIIVPYHAISSTVFTISGITKTYKGPKGVLFIYQMKEKDQ